jgi:hypothetical protein
MIKTIKEVWSSLQRRDKKYLSLALWLIGIIGFLSIFIFPFLFSRDAPFSWMAYTTSESNVGSTINGIATPFIAIAAAILTFLAFWVQYQANVQQRQQFQEQLNAQNISNEAKDKLWRIERFENRYYELLKLHRANVDEMKIEDTIQGRECFIPMFYELRYCYQVASNYYAAIDENLKKEYEYDKFDLMDFSYQIFFQGLNNQTQNYFLTLGKKGQLHLFREVRLFLESVQNKVRGHLKATPQAKSFFYNMPFSGIPDEKTVEFSYVPFKGHSNILGHYYRHLFQTAKYLTSRSFLSEQEKYSYIKTLRAQLSDFEQLLLYYNSLAWFQNEWKEIFTTYRFIKNMPVLLADFYIKPANYFHKEILELRDKGIEIFEFFE